MRKISQTMISCLCGVSLLLSACFQEGKKDLCGESENAHIQNVSRAIAFVDSVTQAGSNEIKNHLISKYEFVGEVTHSSTGKRIDTIETSLVEVVPQFITIPPLQEGFVIGYAYRYSDTSQYLWNVPFVNIGPPARKTDYLYPPFLLFIPKDCEFQLLGYSSSENSGIRQIQALSSKDNPNTTHTFRPKSIDITNLPCLSTSDVFSIYLELETCFLYGPVP